MKMKFTLLAALATLSLNAQVLESDNFEALTIGNVGTNPNSNTTAGQGGWYTLLGSNGTNADADSQH